MTDYSRIYKEVFEIDGSLRDIYILGTNEQDWQTLLNFLHLGTYPIEFIVEGKLRPLPDKIEDIFALAHDYGVSLRIDEALLALHCYFFTIEEIEFDLDPRDFHNEQQISRLLTFIRNVGSLLHKDIILTPENSDTSSYPYLRFNHKTGTEEWFDNKNNLIHLG